jgi:hypothetical protein
MQQFLMMQMHQFQQNQNLFPGMSNSRFETEPTLYPFQPFPSQFFHNSNSASTALPPSKKSGSFFSNQMNNKSDGNKEPTPENSEKLLENSIKTKENNKLDQTKRKESFNDNMTNPSLFNQFTPMSNILTAPNMPNMPMQNLNIPNMPSANNNNNLNMQNISQLSGLNGLSNIPNLSIQNMPNLGNLPVISNLPNFQIGMQNPNVPPQFNYYGSGPNFFNQNSYLPQPNELEFNKSQGNYNFIQMNSGLNPQNQNKNQLFTANTEKNRLNQNLGFFNPNFGMDYPQAENNLDALKNMQGLKDNADLLKAPKE